jgi:hypothetical protein
MEDGVKHRLGVLFDNIQDVKGIREKAGDFGSSKAYTTSDKTSRLILKGCYTGFICNDFQASSYETLYLDTLPFQVVKYMLWYIQTKQ